MSTATWSTKGSIAVITLDNPPVNGLGYELRRGILDGSTGPRPIPRSRPRS